MIPDGKKRIRVCLDTSLLHEIDRHAEAYQVHRSSILAAAVHGAIQSGLLRLSKASIEALEAGERVQLPALAGEGDRR